MDVAPFVLRFQSSKRERAHRRSFQPPEVPARSFLGEFLDEAAEVVLWTPAAFFVMVPYRFRLR
jgi:hypothetical protein